MCTSGEHFCKSHTVCVGGTCNVCTTGHFCKYLTMCVGGTCNVCTTCALVMECTCMCVKCMYK